MKKIFFDTNALTGLYAYSSDTLQQVVSTLERVKNKLNCTFIVPAMVRKEYERHYQKSRSRTGDKYPLSIFRREFNKQKSLLLDRMKKIQPIKLSTIFDTKIDNRNDFRKIVSNAKYVILNADIEINVELFSDLSLTVITYGFNNKATFTVSSITENIIIICLQRIIFNKKGYMIEPQEYQIENQINIEKYTLIAISILDILYN